MVRNKKNDWFKEKWSGVPITPLNIDEHMSDIYKKTSGQYVTQGVSFNKDDAFQMGLLKQALLAHGSFSSFVKHLMHTYFIQQQQIAQLQQQTVVGVLNPNVSINTNTQQSFGWIPDESTKNFNKQQESDIPEDTINSVEKVKVEESKDNLDDKKPTIDTTTTGIAPVVKINKARVTKKTIGKGNPFLETND